MNALLKGIVWTAAGLLTIVGVNAYFVSAPSYDRILSAGLAASVVALLGYGALGFLKPRAGTIIIVVLGAFANLVLIMLMADRLFFRGTIIHETFLR